MGSKLLPIIIVLVAVGVGLYFMNQQQTAETPDRHYVGHSVEECSRIQVRCAEAEGFQRFDDDSGCGCEVI